MQAYTFRLFTFFEAIDKTASLGLHTIESYPGQTLSAEHGDATIQHHMDAELIPAVKAKLAGAGVTLACYGVVGLGTDEAEARAVFEFAKAMGIETVVSEPDEAAFDLVEKLIEEYGIPVAIHNHPKPSHYWNPDTVLTACEGRSPMIGSCADTGHWMRSGVDPLEALQKLEGRIRSVHLKDLDKFGAGMDCHDMPFGRGVGDVKAWLLELRRQGVRTVLSMEYEHKWENSLPELAECVRFVEQLAKETAG